MAIPRPLNTIAAEILSQWPIEKRRTTGFMLFSMPYVEAMLSLQSINDDYGLDPADDIVIRFLSNAASWRGEVARRIKAELNLHLELVK